MALNFEVSKFRAFRDISRRSALGVDTNNKYILDYQGRWSYAAIIAHLTASVKSIKQLFPYELYVNKSA